MENPITAVIFLVALGLVAFIGNYNTKKTIKKTVKQVIDDNHVIKKRDIKHVRRDFIEPPAPEACGKKWGEAPW